MTDDDDTLHQTGLNVISTSLYELFIPLCPLQNFQLREMSKHGF